MRDVKESETAMSRLEGKEELERARGGARAAAGPGAAVARNFDAYYSWKLDTSLSLDLAASTTL
jgi:hypothetical protein